MLVAVHFFPDTQFVDHAIDIYQDINCFKNFFCCFKFSRKSSKIKHKDIIRMNNHKKIIDYINGNADILILYSFCLPYSILLKINPTIKIIWHTVGYDIYSDKSLIGFFDQKKLINISLYHKKTRQYLYSNLHFIIKRFIRFLIFFCFRRTKYINFIANRIDYISTVLPLEKELFSYRLKAKYIHFRFLSNRDKDESFKLKEFCEINILIGNSSTPENNHLDIIDVLIQKKIFINKLIIPLSYGDQRYKKFLLRKINRNFCNIEFLINFLSFGEYKAILESCPFAIFGVVRQQAIGNIYVLLQLGTKIFLYKESIVYKYFKSKGYFIYSIEDDLSTESLKTRLNEEERIWNTNLIEKELNYNELLEILKLQYKSIAVE